MSQLEEGRRRILELEAQLEAQKASQRGECEAYQPVRSFSDPDEIARRT